MTSCPWQIIKAQTAVDPKKKTFSTRYYFIRKATRANLGNAKAKAVSQVSSQIYVLDNHHEN